MIVQINKYQLKSKLLKYQFALLLLLWLVSPAYCQYKILEDEGANEKILQAVDSIYNLNFDAADVIITDLEQKLGDYPGIFLLKSFYVSWKYRPIKKDQESFELFESYLNKGIEKSEEMLAKDKYDVEANFYLMACHAFLAELYVNNDLNFKTLGEAQSAYKHIKFGFDHVEENPEFNFSSGIYNYYREKYPEENPSYKSFIWFFRGGDKEKGLKMLKKGSIDAVFTKAECLTYLFHINLRYEDKPANAIYYARLLKDKYPNNLHYISNFIENSIRLETYDELYPYILRLMESENKYYQYLGEIYNGIYLEKNDKNLNSAIIHYKKANELGDQGEFRIPHYDSMLFLGMGRINKSFGNNELANQYFKKSIKSAKYSAYRKDAEVLLND